MTAMTSPLSATAMMATVADLVALAPRTSGSTGGAAAAEYVAERFRGAGLRDVGFEQTPTFAWSARDHELSVEGQAYAALPIRHCFLPGHDWVGTVATPEEGLAAPLVDVGSDAVKDHDVRGRIVLFDLVFTMTLASMLPLTEYLHDPGRRMLTREVMGSTNPYITSLTTVMEQAAAGGAVGVIGVLRDYPESVNYHNEYYRRSLLSLPGFWVTRSTGVALRQRLAEAGTQPLTASLRLTVDRSEVAARTVVGLLPGRSRDTIMIQSHHDSIGPGAVEDGTGVAEVIALAEHYGERAAAGWRPEKTLLFVTFDSHFTGYHAHMAFARRWILAPETAYRIVLNCTIEHIGLRAVRGPDGGFALTSMTEPRGFFENVSPALKWCLIRSIRRHGLYAASLVNASPLEFSRLGIPTDASFILTSGVPTVSLVSGPLYLYDDADTLDKVDEEQLEPVARTFVDLIDAALPRRSALLGLMPSPLRRRLPRGRW